MSCLISYSTKEKISAKNYQKLMQHLADETFKTLNLKHNFEVSVLLTNNLEIKKLNRKFRKIDKATDVLSFPLLTNKEITSIKSRQLVNLGDIVISHPRASTQAVEYGHSLKREISFLFVHGLLHLLGYDHMLKKQEKVMFELQEKILNSLGIRR